MLVQYNGKNEQGFSKVNSYSFTQVLSRFSRKIHPPSPLPGERGELNGGHLLRRQLARDDENGDERIPQPLWYFRGATHGSYRRGLTVGLNI